MHRLTERKQPAKQKGEMSDPPQTPPQTLAGLRPPDPRQRTEGKGATGTNLRTAPKNTI